MSDHEHPHHHHHAHGPHPHDARAQSFPSFLRLSAVQRLGAAGAVIAVLWGAILWAMS
jgi:hypothetical protein